MAHSLRPFPVIDGDAHPHTLAAENQMRRQQVAGDRHVAIVIDAPVRLTQLRSTVLLVALKRQRPRPDPVLRATRSASDRTAARTPISPVAGSPRHRSAARRSTTARRGCARPPRRRRRTAPINEPPPNHRVAANPSWPANPARRRRRRRGRRVAIRCAAAARKLSAPTLSRAPWGLAASSRRRRAAANTVRLRLRDARRLNSRWSTVSAPGTRVAAGAPPVPGRKAAPAASPGARREIAAASP